MAGRSAPDGHAVTRSKIEKYVIYATRQNGDPWTWWARVPYGTFQRFASWPEAVDFLRLKAHLKADGKTWSRR